MFADDALESALLDPGHGKAVDLGRDANDLDLWGGLFQRDLWGGLFTAGDLWGGLLTFEPGDRHGIGALFI